MPFHRITVTVCYWNIVVLTLSAVCNIRGNQSTYVLIIGVFTDKWFSWPTKQTISFFLGYNFSKKYTFPIIWNFWKLKTSLNDQSARNITSDSLNGIFHSDFDIKLERPFGCDHTSIINCVCLQYWMNLAHMLRCTATWMKHLPNQAHHIKQKTIFIHGNLSVSINQP